MIRPTTAADVEPLVSLAQETGVFKRKEIEVLREVLGDYLQKPGGDDYHCYTFEESGDVLGFICYGPNPMTDGTWDMYWIAVRQARQSKGIGAELVRFAEADVQERGGRMIVVETSSLPSYDATRGFYQRQGYKQPAVLTDFYADGDSLVFFCKMLKSTAERGETAT